jgi:hypothetical protein
MRRVASILAAGVLLAVGLVVAPAAADTPHNPGGPCVQPNQHLPLESIYFYDDVVRELDRIEHKSRGLVTVDSAGQSGEGRELLYATVGTGDTVFWIQGRIHGGERLGTQSALRLLDWLTSGHPDAIRIRDELTVVVIPMYNPDGAEFVTASGTRGIRGSVTPNLNLDLNRDWGPPPAPGASQPFAQPESIAWWHLFAEVLPNYALDYHHVGEAHVVQGTDDLTQLQIGHRPLSVDAFTEEQWRTNRAMSIVVRDAVDHIGGLNTTLYGPAQNPAFHVPNAVISQMLLGENAPPGAEHPGHTVDGALFFEFRSVGQKSSGMLVEVHLAPTKALLTSVTDGSLVDTDISGFDDIPFPQAVACGT